jgi:hypothetical protein
MPIAVRIFPLETGGDHTHPRLDLDRMALFFCRARANQSSVALSAKKCQWPSLQANELGTIQR